MKAATNPVKKAPSAARGKRCDRRVPLHEMHRLMTVYGPLKCQRRRSGQSAPSDVGALKKDSMKRKFYRWFPDLDERFSKDDAGVYVPRFGHETEIRYRTEMRERDGKSLAKKRVQCRRQRSGEVSTNTAQSASTDPAPVSPTSVPRACCFLSSDNNTTSTGMAFDNQLLAQTSSSVLVSDAEPLDRSFLAEANIFDDVDMTFFGGPAVVDEIYSNGSNASSSWENDSSSIDEMLDRSLEECCEEILGSDDDASVSGYLFDMIST